jgi:cobalt/nickel transport system permease protein
LKHSFIDKYSNLDSPVHRIDPRVKLVAVFSVIVIIISEAPGAVFPFIFYGAIIAVLIIVSRIPPAYIMKRCLIAAPFILLAAIFYPVSSLMGQGYHAFDINNPEVKAGLTILLKGFMALILLILLTSTEKFHNLLLGLRKLKMPRLLGVISALMYRYVFIIHDEMLRTTRARDSRTPGRLNISRIKVYGNQSAMIFLRSLERSQIVYNSMLSRGFNGEFPGMQSLSLRGKDVIAAIVFVLLVLSVRLTNSNLICYLFN